MSGMGFLATTPTRSSATVARSMSSASTGTSSSTSSSRFVSSSWGLGLGQRRRLDRRSLALNLSRSSPRSSAGLFGDDVGPSVSSTASPSSSSQPLVGGERRGKGSADLNNLNLSRETGDSSSMTSTSTSATSATSGAVHAPCCPINLKFEREAMRVNKNGEDAGRGLPLEVRRLAGDFIDSEECSAVPQGWWRWWRYQGL